MLRRKIEKQLVAWKSKKNRKCLLVLGARQVGKTFSIREFGKAEYDNGRLDVVASGSLLGMDNLRDSSFPVGYDARRNAGGYYTLF